VGNAFDLLSRAASATVNNRRLVHLIDFGDDDRKQSLIPRGLLLRVGFARGTNIMPPLKNQDPEYDRWVFGRQVRVSIRPRQASMTSPVVRRMLVAMPTQYRPRH
jgi:hypothetical protein